MQAFLFLLVVSSSRSFVGPGELLVRMGPENCGAFIKRGDALTRQCYTILHCESEKVTFSGYFISGYRSIIYQAAE